MASALRTSSVSAARWRRGLARARRVVLVRRRLLAAVLVTAAVAAGLRAVAAPPPPTVPVVVAARPIAAGATITSGDVETVAWPAHVAPAGGFEQADSVLGDELAAGVAAGEPVTEARIVGEGLATTVPGMTALPIRLPDPGVVDLLKPGQRIDLIATDPGSGEARVIADDVLVLAVPDALEESGTALTGTPGSGQPAGRLVILAVTPTTAVSLSGASLTNYLGVAFSG